MRRFHLVRDVDETGVSGTGLVAEGVVFTDGVTVLHWRGDYASTVVWASVDSVDVIHGHNGKTRIVFMDGDDDGSGTGL